MLYRRSLPGVVGGRLEPLAKVVSGMGMDVVVHREALGWQCPDMQANRLILDLVEFMIDQVDAWT